MEETPVGGVTGPEETAPGVDRNDAGQNDGAFRWSNGGAVAPALLLAACGGGSGGGAAVSTPIVVVPTAPVVTAPVVTTPVVVAPTTPVVAPPTPVVSPTPAPVDPTPVTPVTPAPTPTPTPTSSPTPSDPEPKEPVAVVEAPVTPVQASRFLAQATMGATRVEIDKVVASGLSGWIDAQMATPRKIAYYDWLLENGHDAAANLYQTTGFDAMVWSQLITAPDQLRQRVTTALLDFIVVGIGGITAGWPAFSMAAYMDVLADNAFGNYRTLLGAITTSHAMSSYLSFLNNRKGNPTTGVQPDENYARELMQLFTLGLYRLNMDGTPAPTGGNPAETYTQADVSQLARVFTGLTLKSTDFATPAIYRPALVMNAGMNETGASTFLGKTLSGGDGMSKVNAALDVIFAHPNVPPFVSKVLIQRLVTSNPGPAYVARVAGVFADNGKGVRGDLAAVVRAILLDADARSDAVLANPLAGKLREPVQRLTGWARAFGVTSPSNAWAIGDTSSSNSRLGQSIGRAPSVFNFWRPGYSPPGTAISNNAMVSPELQVASEQSVIGYVNFLYGLVANGIGDVKADYTAILTKATNTAALIDEVNLVLASGQLGTATKATIAAAVDSVSPTAATGPINRVGIAIMLTLASPDYLTLR